MATTIKKGKQLSNRTPITLVSACALWVRVSGDVSGDVSGMYQVCIRYSMYQVRAPLCAGLKKEVKAPTLSLPFTSINVTLVFALEFARLAFLLTPEAQSNLPLRLLHRDFTCDSAEYNGSA